MDTALAPSDRLARMGYDVRAIRAHFPALAAGAAHFDGPGGSQVPDTVAAAVADTLLSPLANRGSVTAAERAADAVVLAARAAMGDLLGVDPRGVVFGRSMTALTFDLARTLAATWGPDDEVIVTRLDHDANIRPWIRAAEAVGAAVRFADFDPRTAELTVADVARELSSRTRVVAVTGASNLLGTRPPVPLIAAAAHERGALVVVDGVHLTAHAPVDVAALGADFYACSPYKFLGPHCGVLAAAPDLLDSLSPEKLAPSPDSVPERFELGTLPYELLAGTTAAVDFLAGLDPRTDLRWARHPPRTAHGEPDGRGEARRPAAAPHRGGARRSGSGPVPGVVVHSRAASRTPTLLLSFPGRDPQDAYRFLAERGVNAPAGTFYALEASRRLGFGDRGSLRVGLAPYTDDDDVDRLLDAVGEFLADA